MTELVTEEWRLPLGESAGAALRRYLDEHPAAHFRQSLDWLSAVGPERMRVFVTRRGHRIVAASLVEHCLSRLPFAATARIERGPLFDDDEALLAHLDTLRAAVTGHAINLRISPFVAPSVVSLPAGWHPVSVSALYDSTLVVPILATEEEQWRTLRRSTRTSINRARHEGLLVETAHGEQAFRKFARDYNVFATKRGLALLDDDVLARLAPVEAGDNSAGRCLLLEARQEERCRGAALFVRNGGSLAYEWAWTEAADQGSRVPVLHPLLWGAIGYCRSNGIPELDLGGYLPDRGNDDPINHVKLGFSKTVRHFAPEQRFVLAPVRQAAADAVVRLRRTLSRP